MRRSHNAHSGQAQPTDTQGCRDGRGGNTREKDKSGTAMVYVRSVVDVWKMQTELPHDDALLRVDLVRPLVQVIQAERVVSHPLVVEQDVV